MDRIEINNCSKNAQHLLYNRMPYTPHNIYFEQQLILIHFVKYKVFFIILVNPGTLHKLETAESQFRNT